MIKRLLLFFGMMSCVLTIAGCSGQKEPAKPDYEKQAENAPKDASPEPTQTPSPEATAAPTAEPEQTAEPENIFDRIPTQGNVWKINEIEREYGIMWGHSSPDWTRIFHEMTREEVLSYFGMKLDLADFLPDLQESPDRKYGFYEYQYAGGDSTGIVREHFFSYRDKETYSEYIEEWERYVRVGFREGGYPRYSSLNAHFSEEFRNNHWEPEISVIQGQEVRIVRFTVKREDVMYGRYYLADFLNNNLGVTIESEGVEWEDIQKVIEYLVFYALEREGGVTSQAIR